MERAESQCVRKIARHSNLLRRQHGQTRTLGDANHGLYEEEAQLSRCDRPCGAGGRIPTEGSAIITHDRIEQCHTEKTQSEAIDDGHDVVLAFATVVTTVIGTLFKRPCNTTDAMLRRRRERSAANSLPALY